MENKRTNSRANRDPYDSWIKSVGIPIHGGYYVEDLRTIELGWWPERECNAAFLVLAGQESVTEARVTEIPAGKSLPPMKFAFDECVYVADGQGFCTVWADGGEKKSFEWNKHSLFLLPRNHNHQLANARGASRAVLLHSNYLPVGMLSNPNPDFWLNSPVQADRLSGDDLFSEAKVRSQDDARRAARVREYWVGNFFPNMRVWDKLVPYKGRGAGGTTVFIEFPDSPMGCHMSVFPAGTYKKAHRHGPGFVIVIPAGDGYSVMWPEGQDKVIVPWHEGSVFVPPDQWFHQHFNVGEAPARYLALSPPGPFSRVGERVKNPALNTIQYPDEEPWIRQKFEEELAKRGHKSLMPEQAYRDHDYEWAYAEEG